MPPIYQSNGIECYYEQLDQCDVEQQGHSRVRAPKAERALRRLRDFAGELLSWSSCLRIPLSLIFWGCEWMTRQG